MKKLLLFITVLFFGISTINAQDDANYGFAQGDWVLGGGFNFTNADDGTDEAKSSTIAPTVHYFVSDTWAVGASVGLMSMDDGNGKESNTVIGFEARNYFMDMGEKSKWYFNLGFSNTSGDSFDDSVTGIGAGLGMNYFMNENIIIDFGLSNILSYAKSGDVSATSFGWSGEINSLQGAATFSIIFKM
mgnify:FL=1|tara:strand:- start:406 stop:969 length:564 start_codon:yes stop_codon:yes gene_type:complete